MAAATTPAPYSWPVKPFNHQHPVRGFLCDPRIAAGGRTFHFGIDVASPGGTPVYAVAPGKVSFGSPADVAQNGGIVVVEADGRNFGYWHVAPAVQPGARVPLHGLLGHVAAQPEDWGHVHFAESTNGSTGISYWNPLRAGALTPFFDYGPPVLDTIMTSLPPGELHGLVDFSVKAHDNTPIEITQPQPPGWQGMPVTPARIRWRLMRAMQPVVPWQVAVDHRNSFHPDVQGSPASDVNFGAVYAPDTTQNNPNAPGLFHFWLKRGFDTSRYPDGSYVLEVEASDVRGNPSTDNLTLTFVNAKHNA
jgi:Peptidase family M23